MKKKKQYREHRNNQEKRDRLVLARMAMQGELASQGQDFGFYGGYKN